MKWVDDEEYVEIQSSAALNEKSVSLYFTVTAAGKFSAHVKVAGESNPAISRNWIRELTICVVRGRLRQFSRLFAKLFCHTRELGRARAFVD